MISLFLFCIYVISFHYVDLTWYHYDLGFFVELFLNVECVMTMFNNAIMCICIVVFKCIVSLLKTEDHVMSTNIFNIILVNVIIIIFTITIIIKFVNIIKFRFYTYL